MLPIISALEAFLIIFNSLPFSVIGLIYFGLFIFVVMFVLRLLLSL